MMRTATQSPTMDEVLAIVAPTKCRCGGGCMMCDDDGMRHVEVIAAGGYGYVTTGDVEWGEVEVAFTDRDPVRVHWSQIEVMS